MPAAAKAPGSVTPAVNPALTDAQKQAVKDIPHDFYKPEDEQYLTYFQQRLERAKRVYDSPMPEMNNKTVYNCYEENEKIANTHHLDPKKNDDDVVVSSGTIEEKLDSLLSHVNNLNLSGELDVYDHEKQNILALARALEDIVFETECNEPGSDDSGDEEKRIARQRELLVQGYVYVQEEWLRQWEMKKQLKNKADRFSGKFKDVEWTSKLTKVFEGPSRTMLYSPNVYLGDITQFYMENQPYIFIVVRMSYDVAKTRYGKFENWQYVQKGKLPQMESDTAKTIFENKWRLTDLKDDEVEVVMYQDQPNDEFQIVINGVMMLPIGFPLSAVAPRGRYNVAKQVFRIINEKFALGKGFVSSGSVQEISKLIDEMLRLFVLKTRKSIMPSYVNTSGRVIDRKVLMPGRISMGLDAGALQPIAGNDVQGITAGEMGWLTAMRDLVDKSTVSNQFAGQAGKSGTTATEVNTLQQQAQLTLGLTISVCGLLEKKLKYLRTFNILENWFQPIGDAVKTVNGVKQLVKQYRQVARETNIDGAGSGSRTIYVSEDPVPEPQTVRNAEIAMEKATGKPTRNIFINPTELADAKLFFMWRVVPKERDSSTMSKLMFRQEISDVIALVKLGSRPNLDGLEEELGRVWGKPRNKLFQAAMPAAMMAGMAGVSGAMDPSQVENARGEGNAPDVPMTPGALSGGGGVRE